MTTWNPPPVNANGRERTAAIGPVFHRRCHEIAAALTPKPLPAEAAKWLYEARVSESDWEAPSGALVREDHLRLWISAGHSDNRVECYPAQVPMREPGEVMTRQWPLKGFLPYDERRDFKATAGIDLQRFVNAPVRAIAQEISRKVVIPAAHAWGYAVAAQKGAAERASLIEAAEADLMRVYGATRLSHGQKGVWLSGYGPVSVVTLDGPNAYRIGQHALVVSRRVLDAMLREIAAEKAEAGGGGK